MEAAKVSPPRSRRRAACVAFALVIAGALACVPAADAQEPGVVYEKGSPSEKEYAIPLEEARNEAGGDRPGRQEAIAFGIGLSRNGSGGAGDRSGRGAEGSKRGSGDAQRPSAPRTEAGDRTGQGLEERIREAEEAGAPFLWRLGPLLLVLLPALIVAILLAGRDRGRPVAA
jgi:hypothetical protein